MAEKGFGVKEVNLIGASGTPTITSPNNLNLNAVNVAISTNASIGGNLTVSGTVGIAGTLTYEDVTNVDAVGIITAREGVFIPDNKELKIGQSAASPDLKIYSDGTNGYVREQGPGSLYIQGINVVLENTSGTNYFAGVSGAESIIYHNGNAKITTSSSGATVTGTLVATTFSGSGASLTSLPAANLTGTLPAISGANLTGIAVTEAPVTDYTITADGGSNYYFHGGGVDETDGNPDLYLIRGQKYRFNNTTGSGHPFALRVSSGGSAYTDGVTGSQNGIQFFTVPYTAPASLVYQCTIHGGMVGNIFISGGDGTHKIVADANPVMEFDRGSANNTNLNLKYNGTLTGQLSVANEEVQLSTVGSNTDIAFYVGGIKKGYWKDTGELWFGSNNTYIKANQIRFGEAGAAYIDQYTTGQDINFRTSVSSALDTTGMTLKSNGNLAFASGKGIDFGATGGPASGTGGSEILSDYEQGTFSPAWFDDGGAFVSSYSVQYGQYTKIGNVVYFCFGLRIGSFSRTPNSGQACRVGNLPYVSRVVGDDQEPVFNLYARLWGSGTPPETAWIRQSSGGSGSNHVEFYMDESQTGNDHQLVGADFDTSSTCRVVVNGFYFTTN